MRSKGFKLQIRHPNPYILHKKDKPLKRLPLKINREYIQESYRVSTNRKFILKGLIHRLTQPENQCKIFRVKSTWTTGEENKLTNEASARDVGTSWDASWGLNHGWEPFMWYLANIGPGRHHSGNLHINLLALVGVPNQKHWLPLHLGQTS